MIGLNDSLGIAGGWRQGRKDMYFARTAKFMWLIMLIRSFFILSSSYETCKGKEVYTGLKQEVLNQASRTKLFEKQTNVFSNNDMRLIEIFIER